VITDRRAVPSPGTERTAFAVLAAISFSHLLNDTMQSLIPAIYPILKSSFGLSFTQVGLMTLALMLTASLLQPVVGFYADRRPTPYSLVVGMGFSFVGLLLLSFATTFATLLLAAALVGIGSSVFHPESSRVARMASGGRHGLAQSLFQVGGNVGSSFGPLLAAFLVVPRGQSSVGWCALLALVGMVILWKVGGWYRTRRSAASPGSASGSSGRLTHTSNQRVGWSIAILAALIFSKYFYLASLTTYYTFYLISKFHVGVRTSQIDLFVFLGAVAAGTILGGPIGDRFGRKYVIWGSILGVLPFTLLLPHASLFWTSILTVPIGLILASAFSAIVVYAQELVPGRVGLISGVFFGFAFGMGGLGAAVLGQLADRVGIEAVYGMCAFLPMIGLLAAFLPNDKTPPQVPSLPPRIGSALTHAGGVVHREENGDVVMLLVRARREPHDWVLPKGHIEAGETPAQTAQREVCEEAGVDARPTGYLGVLTFQGPGGEPIRVGLFLMRFVGNVPAQEDREIRWCSFREAAQLVKFEDVRQMLEAAERMTRVVAGSWIE
jgi:FSR family fosmidomycin resistance protein-like MFS transporter